LDYRRRNEWPPPDKINVKRWFRFKMSLLEIGLLDALARVSENPNRDVSASAALTMFPALFETAPQNILLDFQEMARKWPLVKQEEVRKLVLQEANKARENYVHSGRLLDER